MISHLRGSYPQEIHSYRTTYKQITDRGTLETELEIMKDVYLPVAEPP
jgi:hypothetical protein